MLRRINCMTDFTVKLDYKYLTADLGYLDMFICDNLSKVEINKLQMINLCFYNEINKKVHDSNYFQNLDIYSINFYIDAAKYKAITDWEERKNALLVFIKDSIKIMCERNNWDFTPFKETFDKIKNRDIIFLLLRKKYKISKDGLELMFNVIRKYEGNEKFKYELVVQTLDEQTILREFIFEVDDIFYVPIYHFNKMVFDKKSSTLKVLNESGELTFEKVVIL